MRWCLLILALLLPGVARADSTVPALPDATSLATAKAYLANGGANDNRVGFDNTPFCVAAGSITLCTGGVALSKLAGLGTGVSTALQTNVGTAGSFVTNGGALGTPSSGTGTNITGIPVANLTGILGGANGGTGINNGGNTLTLNGSASLPAAPASPQCLHMSPGGGITPTGSDCPATPQIVFSGTTAGTANAQTVASPLPSTFTFTDGFKLHLKIGAATNTGSTTLSVSGGSAIAVATQDATGALAALTGGEFTTGLEVDLTAQASCPAPISANCYVITTTPGNGAIVTGSTTITNAQWFSWQPVTISTSAQTITLPVATSLSTKGGLVITTIGNSITLAPNAADGINGGTINTSVTIPANITTVVTTSGSSGTGAFKVPLGLVAGSNITLTPNTNGTTTLASSGGTTFSVDTNAALAAMNATTATQVIRLGFTTRGDVSPVLYRGTGSACSAADNGAQVTAANSNCFIAMFDGTNRTVDQWGADPTGSADSRTAIVNAITASYSTTTCNVLWFTGNYKIAGTAGLVLGNGSSSGESTLGCTPVLSGTSNPISFGTLFGNSHQPTAPRIFSTTVTDNMITVKGPLYGWGVRNLIIDCGNTSGTEGLNVISAQNGDSSNLAILKCFRSVDSSSVVLPAGMTNSDALHNKYTNIITSQPDQTNTIGFYIHGDGQASPTSNTDYNYFNNLSIFCGTSVGHNCYPFYLEVSDSNTFWDVHVLGGNAGSTFINFQYTTNNNFPSANAFYAIDCGASTVTWSNGGSPGGGAATNLIYGLLAANSCAIPGNSNLTVH